jgi:WhiB family transcriptional regulator, redox-sensing transcriptional regulator
MSATLKLTPTGWRARALCAGSTANFFPKTGETGAAAKAVCARCPVFADCHAEMLEIQATYGRKGIIGIWAGTAERDRRNLPAGRG